jgi:hypothetical protein
VDVIGAFISHSKSIKEVILSDNPFGDAVLLKMAVAIRYNASLTLLDIRRCDIRGTQSASSHLSAALTPLFGRKPPCRILVEEPHTMGIRLQNRVRLVCVGHGFWLLLTCLFSFTPWLRLMKFTCLNGNISNKLSCRLGKLLMQSRFGILTTQPN